MSPFSDRKGPNAESHPEKLRKLLVGEKLTDYNGKTAIPAPKNFAKITAAGGTQLFFWQFPQ
jgi:hypothetical protein